MQHSESIESFQHAIKDLSLKLANKTLVLLSFLFSFVSFHFLSSQTTFSVWGLFSVPLSKKEFPTGNSEFAISGPLGTALVIVVTVMIMVPLFPSPSKN